jgi:hypothetical protein
MTEWRIPAAIDAIVTALQATALTVWDGPMVTGDFTEAVYIGYDAAPDGGEELASTTVQQWASGIGQRARDEENEIVCAAACLLGDEGWKAVRDRVAAMLEIVGKTLRGNDSIGPSLGLSPPSVAELWPGQYFQEALEQGYQGRLAFTIRYKTRV